MYRLAKDGKFSEPLLFLSKLTVSNRLHLHGRSKSKTRSASPSQKPSLMMYSKCHLRVLHPPLRKAVPGLLPCDRVALRSTEGSPTAPRIDFDDRVTTVVASCLLQSSRIQPILQNLFLVPQSFGNSSGMPLWNVTAPKGVKIRLWWTLWKNSAIRRSDGEGILDGWPMLQCPGLSLLIRRVSSSGNRSPFQR